ncbi:uncharacterized protein LOC135138601 [Zophobas morio]|uniref:uncharacterized protein LOC135138601 n=1 Tax=Zophobas morio TaxID=2755281 RepID=UPI0030832018
MQFDETDLSTPKQIVEAFKNFFSSVFISSSIPTADPFATSTNWPSINLTTISDEEVDSSIKKLKPNMSAGLDCVPTFLVSDCSNALLAPLTLIFNKCIQTSTFPDVWKLARICPVLKSGESSNIHDLKLYRVINFEEDCRLLQEDLNRVSRWGHNNDLLLNTDKCHIVSYSRKLNVLHFDYLICDTNLNRSDFARDLGVIFDMKLSFNDHMNHVVTSSLKSPFYNYQSLNLEFVQQRFLEYLYFRTHAVYPLNGYSQQLLLLGISYWVPSLQT